LLWLSDGNAPTCFFHAHANSRRHKNHIHSLTHDCRVLAAEADKVEVAFNFYNTLLGHQVQHRQAGPPWPSVGRFVRARRSLHGGRNLGGNLGSPPDKALGPDGFMARFLQVAWPVIRVDIMWVFYALWHADTRSWHAINQALLVLLPESPNVCTIKDFRPISLIHVVGKFISKGPSE
jgi:hypothetical protein